jgi:serine/threonine protein kinase
MSDSPQSIPPTSGRSIGRYLLFGEIASGGMATVHFGRLSGPAGFARTVAIKRLHPHFAKDHEFVTMFLDEARLAARIRHPNVVPTLDVVATEGEIFLVMEYVQGESLARLIRGMRTHEAPSDPRIVATIMSGVLHGLHAAHEARSEQGAPLNIVHRDVSPQNVIVGSDGVPRVLDFGVAKAIGRLQTTREGQIKGKFAYMPPEQLHGTPVTRQCDVYASAVVAWEALTGQRLFKGETEAAMVTAVLHAPVPPPSQLAPHVPPAFDRVVMRGLQRETSLRYRTAREMAIDLERCAGIASASEVGTWVEWLASDELHKRAERIAEIESVTSGQVVPQMMSTIVERKPASSRGPSGGSGVVTALDRRPKAGGATQTAADARSEVFSLRSDVSSIAVGTPVRESLPPRKSRVRTAMLAALGGGAVIGVVALAVVVGRRGDRAAPIPTSVSISSPAPTAANPAAGSGSIAVIPASALPIVLPPGVRTRAGGGRHSPVQPVAPTPGPQSPTQPPPTPPPTPTTNPDCDPPYTFDDKGHKIFKPACFP